MRITETQLRELIHESIREVILEMSPRKMKELQEFITQARAIHGDKYDYSKVVYKGTDDKVCIICPKHGEFWQSPHHHLQGQKCRACVREYKLETRTANELTRRNIEFNQNTTPFPWLGRLQLDFYIPSLNIAIECQGIQHFKPRQRFGGQKGYEIQIERDRRKASLCRNHNIPLYFISYKEWKNIPEIINQILQNHSTT